MAQEASGNPYYSQNPTGAGAVYFDKTVDPLQVHLQGLDDYGRRQAEDRALKQQKLGLGYKMLGDLNPDIKGIMDTDADYFKGKLQELQDSTAKLYASGAPVDSPEFQKQYAQLQYLKKAIETDAQSSGAQKAQLFSLQNTVAQNPDKYDVDKWNKALATYRMSDLPTRSQYNLANGVVAIPNDLTGLIDDTWGKTRESAKTITETPVEQGGRAFTKSSETYDPKQLLGLSQGFAADYKNGKSIDRAWDGLTPDEKLMFVDGAKLAEQTFGEPVDPKTYYVFKQFQNRAGSKQTMQGGAFTPERTQRAEGQDERDAAEAAYAVINGIRELNPEVFDNASLGENGFTVKTLGDNYAISTKLQGSNYGVRQKASVPNAEGKVSYETVPNKIIAMRINPTDPSVIEIRTEADAIAEAKGTTEDAQGNVVTPAATWRKVPATQFETVWFSSNFKDAPTGIQRMKEAAKKYGDVNKEGIVNPTQTRSVGFVPTQNVSVKKTYEPETTTAEGIPVGRKAPKAIVSDGKNLNSWVKTNQYQVGGNIYYYDNNTQQWQKK